MNKEKAVAVLNLVSVLLVVTFAVKCVADWFQYNETLNSAPFSLWIIVNAIYLLLPAAVTCTAAILIKKKQKHSTKK